MSSIPLLCSPISRYALAVTFFCCAFASHAGSDIEPIEYSVMSTLLKHGLDADVKKVLILAETITAPNTLSQSPLHLEQLAYALSMPAPALDDWLQQNKQPSPLERLLTLAAPYELLSADKVNSLFPGNDPKTNWEGFFQKYPHTPGIIRLSRVGFDGLQQNALLYLELECGPACGSGRLVHLEKTELDTWQVVGGELIWITSNE